MKIFTPNSLRLKKVNTDNKEADILDLRIKVLNSGKGKIEIYDKRDDYTFKIINFPDPEANINIDMCYSTFKEEIHRIGTVTNCRNNFIARSRKLVDNLINKKYNRNRLLICFRSTVCKYKLEEKFGNDLHIHM